MGYSDSRKSDENNTSSKPASPVVYSDVVEIKETCENVVVVDEEGEGGEDGFASDASESKSKSSYDEVDYELLDLLAGASEGCSGGNNNDEVKNFAYADHKMHVLTERERRKEMKNKFEILHALIPNLPEKVGFTILWVCIQINHLSMFEILTILFFFPGLIRNSRYVNKRVCAMYLHVCFLMT